MIRTAACSSSLDVTLCSPRATLPTLQMNLVGQNGLADSRLLETGPVRLLETGRVRSRSGPVFDLSSVRSEIVRR